MERRTGRQEEMERISKNSKVCRKPPNYAESRRVSFGKGATEEGRVIGTSLVPYFILRRPAEIKGPTTEVE
jgi:hypothetical protein